MNRHFTYPRKYARCGMVLFEVLIALTLFTLVAFSLVMVLNVALETAKERNKIAAATLGLENQMALLHASHLLPIDNDLPDDGSGITYHLTIATEQVENQKKQPLSGIYRATITAKWRSGSETEDRSISELIYQP